MPEMDGVDPVASLHEPLGALVVQFANLESQVTRAIGSLLPIDYLDGVALEWLMQSFSIRIELFHFLANQKSLDQSHKNYAEKVVSALKQANTDRNDIIHGAWTGQDGPGRFHKVRLQATAGELRNIPVHDITADLLWKEVKYVIALSQHVAMWVQFFRFKTAPPAWPIPSPDRFPQRSPLNSLLRGQKPKATVRQPRPSRA